MDQVDGYPRWIARGPLKINLAELGEDMGIIHQKPGISPEERVFSF
jgi:hypothetical protein